MFCAANNFSAAIFDDVFSFSCFDNDLCYQYQPRHKSLLKASK